MAEDVTSLVLKVESSQVTKAGKELDRFGWQAEGAEKATGGVTKAFKALLVPLLATVSATAALKKLVSITREFDILNAQLITATGSAENAAIAFGAIQQFAVDTPFQLGEVTEAFVQLVNRGLDPSEESLTNIGNFASAFGRNILDATRAVGQATTGEFESLKQFGIVARKVGDEVNFTFRGVTKTVAFNAKEIQGYMDDLAANNFAGAMEERMDSLDGAISNLEDAWDKMWLTASDSGAGELAEEVVLTIISAVEKLEEVLVGNEAGVILEGFATALKLIREESNNVNFDELANGITTIGAAISRFGGDGNFRGGLLENYLETYESAVREMGRGELAKSIEDLNSHIINQEAAVKSALDQLAQDPGSNVLAVQAEEATNKLQVLRFMLEGVQGEMRTFVDTSTSDRLSGFIQSGDLGGPTASMLKQFEKLQFSLLGEGEKIEEVYRQQQKSVEDIFTQSNTRLETIQKARAEIIGSTTISGDDKTEFLKTLQIEQDLTVSTIERANQTKLDLEAKFQEDMAELVGGGGEAGVAFERLRESLLTEEEAIQESYERRKQIILDSTLTTEEEKAKTMARLEKAHAEEVRAFEFERWDTALSSFDDFQTNLLTLAKTGSSEIAGVYKAAAIANTIIKTYESATSAYAAMAGIPFVGPALGAAAAAAAVAAGLANVQAISSQQVGQFANGGIVGGNNYNGDNLTAGVNSGEMILNFSQQKQLLDMANGSGGGGSKPIVINVENYGGGETEVTETETDNERIINIAVNRAVSTINNNIRTGAGDTEKALQTRDKRTA